MARNIKFTNGGHTWESGITKVDRDKVYGYVKTEIYDSNGGLCSTASLLDDGSTLILSGSTALKSVDKSGAEVSKKGLKAVHLDGTPAEQLPSVFDAEIALTPASLDTLFDLEVKSIYQLSFDDETVKHELIATLANGNLFSFKFNYRADYTSDDALLVAAQNEVFILTGKIIEFPFLNNEIVQIIEDELEEMEEEEEIDFGLF